MKGIDVDSVLNPEGEPEVALTVEDQGRRWFRQATTYLRGYEARQLAYELLEAAGFHYAAVLDEELDHLQNEAEATTSVAEYERLVLLKSMVQMMRRMFPETVS